MTYIHKINLCLLLFGPIHGFYSAKKL